MNVILMTNVISNVVIQVCIVDGVLQLSEWQNVVQSKWSDGRKQKCILLWEMCPTRNLLVTLGLLGLPLLLSHSHAWGPRLKIGIATDIYLTKVSLNVKLRGSGAHHNTANVCKVETEIYY